MALAACVAEPVPNRYAPTGSAAATQADATGALPPGRRVAILLPLTGSGAELGQSMLKAAQLSLAAPDAPPLQQYDTTGTPEGAAAAMQAALKAGAGLVLGPLTAGETTAVAPLARAAGVPVLAFTSDAAQSQPGVWAMGITPQQQMRRLVLALQAESKTRLAAVVPSNAFGEALAGGMLATARAAQLPEPRIIRTSASFSNLSDSLKTISDFNNRRGAIEAAQRAARASTDADTRRTAAEIGQRTPGPPPMDALLLGASGQALVQAVPLLSFYDIGPDQVRILGPAIWAREASRLQGLAGAWYAAPEPGLRAGFEQQYAAKNGAPPRDLASLAFDAAGIAGVVATSTGFPVNSLVRPEGFAGADGLIALLPDGQVRRGLAIFEIDRSGAHMVQPAPKTAAAPGV